MSKISSALDKLSSQTDYTPVAVRPFEPEELAAIEQLRRKRNFDDVAIETTAQPTATLHQTNLAAATVTESLSFTDSNIHRVPDQFSDEDDLIIEINDPATNELRSPEGELDQLVEAIELGLGDEFAQTTTIDQSFDNDDLEIIVQEDSVQETSEPQPEQTKTTEHASADKSAAEPSAAAEMRRPTIFSPIQKLADVQPSLRKLCHRMLDHLPSSSPSSVLFLRSGDEEETSVAIADLAIVFSRLELGEVLVIDAASQMKATDDYGSHKQHGFFQVVTGQSTCGESVFPTSTPGVSLMPCGANAALLDEVEYQKEYSTSYNRVIGQLKDLYQFIFIDGGVITQFSKSLATESNAKYLMVQLHQSSRETVEESFTQLQRWNHPADGCVLLD